MKKIDKSRPELGYVPHVRASNPDRSRRPVTTSLDGFVTAKHYSDHARDPSRQAVDVQIAALSRNIEHLTKQLRKAAKKGNTYRMHTLASQITKQRGRLFSLVERFNAPPIPEPERIPPKASMGRSKPRPHDTVKRYKMYSKF